MDGKTASEHNLRMPYAKFGSQPGSSMKLGLAIRAMVAADVNRLKRVS